MSEGRSPSPPRRPFSPAAVAAAAPVDDPRTSIDLAVEDADVTDPSRGGLDHQDAMASATIAIPQSPLPDRPTPTLYNESYRNAMLRSRSHRIRLVGMSARPRDVHGIRGLTMLFSRRDSRSSTSVAILRDADRDRATGPRRDSSDLRRWPTNPSGHRNRGAGEQA